ncbi:MAG: ArdC family protein, partial [Umezawaea sp.]
MSISRADVVALIGAYRRHVARSSHMPRYTTETKQEFARREAALIAHLNEVLADTAAMTRIRTELADAAETVRTLDIVDQVFLWQQTNARGQRLHDVATYEQWRARGRHVLKGSKALRVIATATAVSLDAKGNHRVEDGTRTRAQWFDISDTQLIEPDPPDNAGLRRHTAEKASSVEDPAPTNSVSTADSAAASALAALIIHADEVGYLVRRHGDTVQADFGSGELTLPADLDDKAALRALAPLLPVLQAHPHVAIEPIPASAAAPASEQPAEVAEPALVEKSAVHLSTGQLRPVSDATTSNDAGPSTVGDEPLRMDLGDYGAARVRYSTNYATGRTAYQVTAPHLAGTFTIGPEWVDSVEDIEVIPQGIDVEYGDEAHTHRSYRGYRTLPDAPVVYGIEVSGGNTYTAEQIADGRIRSGGWRRTGPHTSEQLPTKSQARLTAVVRALVDHWTTRADVEDLRLISARLCAQGRRNRHVSAMRELDSEIAALTERRGRHADAAATFATLLEPEHHALAETPEHARRDHDGAETTDFGTVVAPHLTTRNCVECGENRVFAGEACLECRACRTEDCDGDSTHWDSWDGYCPNCADRREMDADGADEDDEMLDFEPGLTELPTLHEGAHGPQWMQVLMLQERVTA